MNVETKIRVITFDDIIKTKGCNIDNIIDIIEAVFIKYKAGKILLPDKISQIFDSASQDRINCMAATLIDEKVSGVKWVSVFPNNPSKYSLPNVNGTILLSEIKTGKLLAVMDGTFITTMRTACVGGIAAKYLANSNSRKYCSIGAGEQAKAHFIVMKHLFCEIDTCYVASRTQKSVKEYIKYMKRRFPDVTYINCGSNYSEATKNADIIVTAVSCQEPLLKANMIKKGSFYCHVGGWEDEYAVPFMASKIICDDWQALKHRGSPTLAKLYKEGLLRDADIYADLADIIDGTKNGRENEDEFIYFNSIGLAFVDIAVAYEFYSEIAKKNDGKVCTLRSSEDKMLVDSIVLRN